MATRKTLDCGAADARHRRADPRDRYRNAGGADRARESSPRQASRYRPFGSCAQARGDLVDLTQHARGDLDLASAREQPCRPEVNDVTCALVLAKMSVDPRKSPECPGARPVS